jgi:peptide subunit release factor 1 (eRF1)
MKNCDESLKEELAEIFDLIHKGPFGCDKAVIKAIELLKKYSIINRDEEGGGK